MKKKSLFRIFAFIGRSGSGKGTQVEFLKQTVGNLYHINSGDLLRRYIQKKTPFAKKVKEIVLNGDLPPAWFVSYLWISELLWVYENKKGYRGVVLEGTPRRLVEAKIMDQVAYLLFETQVVPIYIAVSAREVTKRLLKRLTCKKCGLPLPIQLLNNPPKRCPSCGGFIERRPDDTPEAIRRRMEFFRRNVIPVIKYYQKQGRLITIQGEQSPEMVFKNLMEEIKKRALL